MRTSFSSCSIRAGFVDFFTDHAFMQNILNVNQICMPMYVYVIANGPEGFVSACLVFVC